MAVAQGKAMLHAIDQQSQAACPLHGPCMSPHIIWKEATHTHADRYGTAAQSLCSPQDNMGICCSITLQVARNKHQNSCWRSANLCPLPLGCRPSCQVAGRSRTRTQSQ